MTAPNVLPSTSRRSAPETSNRPVPVVYGAWSHSASTVLPSTSPTPVHTSRAGPTRESRCGHSSASTSTGPTSSTSPAYPRYLPTGISARTTGSTDSATSPSAGGVDCAPTE